MWSGPRGKAGGGGTGRFSSLPPSPTTPSILADEPTSPSIDLQAKHVPASAVVSSAMNSAPVLGTSPSSPTFTFALGRHYSKDCSECSPHPHPPSPFLPGLHSLCGAGYWVSDLLSLAPAPGPPQRGGPHGSPQPTAPLTLWPNAGILQAASRPAAAPPTCWPSPRSAPSPAMTGSTPSGTRARLSGEDGVGPAQPACLGCGGAPSPGVLYTPGRRAPDGP